MRISKNPPNLAAAIPSLPAFVDNALRANVRLIVQNLKAAEPSVAPLVKAESGRS